MNPQDRTRAVLRSGLDPESRLIAVALCDYMSEGRETAWPSVASLVADTGIGERTVQRRLRAGEAAGWLVATREAGRSTVYALRWEALPARRTPPEGCQADTPVTETPPSQGHPWGVTETPQGCQADTRSDHGSDHGSDQETPLPPAERGAVIALDDVQADAVWSGYRSAFGKLIKGGLPAHPTRGERRLLRGVLRVWSVDQCVQVIRWAASGQDARSRFLIERGHVGLRQLLSGDRMVERLALAERSPAAAGPLPEVADATDEEAAELDRLVAASMAEHPDWYTDMAEDDLEETRAHWRAHHLQALRGAG